MPAESSVCSVTGSGRACHAKGNEAPKPAFLITNKQHHPVYHEAIAVAPCLLLTVFPIIRWLQPLYRRGINRPLILSPCVNAVRGLVRDALHGFEMTSGAAALLRMLYQSKAQMRATGISDINCRQGSSLYSSPLSLSTAASTTGAAACAVLLAWSPNKTVPVESFANQ